MFYYKVTTNDTGAAGALRMHSTADKLESSVISSVPHGAIVQATGVAIDTNGMRYVSYNGTWGWVAVEYLTPCDADGNTSSSYDKQTNVVPTNNDSASADTTSSKQVDGKKWLIIGGAALAVGAMMNVFM